MYPPIAKTIPVSTTLFHDTRVDQYAWLRNREDPDTIAYLEAENAYTTSVMQPTEELQKKLYAEMLGRIKQTDETVPIRRGEYFYYSRTEEGKQYAIYCRKHGSLEAPEEILLDGNQLAEGHEYMRLGNFIVSPDDRMLAYSVDFEGDETYIIRVKDLSTGALLPDEIPNTYYSLEWAADSATFFYCTLDEALRPFKVFRHRLGETRDTLVHHEPDERYTVEVAQSSSREYILINLQSSLTSEVRYISSAQPEAAFLPVLERVQNVEYDVTHHGDYFYIRTNDNA
ncbi:MAG: oligopeptidase B, partial [Acidobacteriota bacterium]